ncbi:MAG TPA: YbaK/EbsC family protein [Candidatus Baltobacteraceae bacterium]|nr:YbaK/EbsC family protein [Candidatus Baltobacteraceae bacterium]
MAVAKPLLKYLDKAEIKYEIVPHKKVYTAYDLAQTLGENLDGIAKTLLVKVELPNVAKHGKYYILVIPASYRANFNKIKKALNAKKVEMAVEKQLKKLKLNPGAITPFGGYHKIEVLLDKTLMKTQKVLASAGAHTEALRVKVKDLHEKENATLGEFGDKAKIKLQKVLKKAKKSVKKAAKKAKKILKKKKA